MKTFEELNKKIIGWAHDRNIINGATPEKQASKTLEECEELISAVAKLTVVRDIAFNYDLDDQAGNEIKYYKAQVIDAIGDIIVTLCIQSEMQGVNIVGCIQSAYDEIKDRKGAMRNGKFVKEADL
jgi:NTP pyrophosphatase (non-canonical NTP hydrolase)